MVYFYFYFVNDAIPVEWILSIILSSYTFPLIGGVLALQTTGTETIVIYLMVLLHFEL